MCEKPSESVIRKIQKLLAIGQHKTTSENEAAAAMSMAQELLAKYNLDMSIIQDTVVVGGTAQEQEKREQTKINKSAAYKWQQRLCRVIAEANFCWYWAQEFNEQVTRNKEQTWRKVKRHVVLGSEVNSIAVTMMYSYLAETIEDIIPYRASEKLSKSAVSWREGCASRLEERITELAYRMQHPEEKEGLKAKETGLVLQSLVKKEYGRNYDALYGEGCYERSLVRQAEYAAKPKEPEVELTDAEKAKQQKASDKWWEKYQREQQREIDKRDLKAFMAGRQTAETISLQDRIK
jgi:hypothetical protein